MPAQESVEEVVPDCSIPLVGVDQGWLRQHGIDPSSITNNVQIVSCKVIDPKDLNQEKILFHRAYFIKIERMPKTPDGMLILDEVNGKRTRRGDHFLAYSNDWVALHTWPAGIAKPVDPWEDLLAQREAFK